VPEVRLLALLAALICSVGMAPGAVAGETPGLLVVRDAWVRATVEGQTGSGAFMHLTAREDARLVGASSPAAQRVEIHEMRVVNDMMTMRRIETLPLPAATTVALDHEFHIMLIGLRRQLQPGQDVKITLQVLDSQGMRHAIDVVAPVRALNAAPARSSP
jgi:periplasmic copper chaperone A